MSNSDASPLMGLVMSNADCESAMKMAEMCFNESLPDRQQAILQPSLIKDLALITYESYKMLNQHYPNTQVMDSWNDFSSQCETFRHAVHITNVIEYGKLRDRGKYEFQDNVLNAYLDSIKGITIITKLVEGQRHIVWCNLYYSHLYSYQNSVIDCVQSINVHGNVIYRKLKGIQALYRSMHSSFDLSHGFKPIPSVCKAMYEDAYITKAAFFDSKILKQSNILKLLICKTEINVVMTYLESSDLASLLSQSDWIYFITKWLAIKYDEIIDCLDDLRNYDTKEYEAFCAMSLGRYKTSDANLRQIARSLRNTCHYIRYDSNIDGVSSIVGDTRHYDFFRAIFTLIGITDGYNGMLTLYNQLLNELLDIDECIDSVFLHMHSRTLY